MRKAELFIVGAPKCGTTALADFLDQHPKISVLPKEIHFFGSDLEFSKKRVDSEKYEDLINTFPEENLVCDASVHYLFSDNAAKEIKQYNPDARIIIMLRQPVDVMYSMHAQRLRTADEDIHDFAEALDAQKDRAEGTLALPPSINAKHAWQYEKIADFEPQIRRYVDQFGWSSVKIYLQEDLSDKPMEIYKEILEFLCVDSEFSPEFKKVNVRRGMRFPIVRKLYKRTDRFKREKLKNTLPGFIREPLRKLFWFVVFKKDASGPIDPQLKKELTQKFDDKIISLGRFIGRDLSHWRQLD